MDSNLQGSSFKHDLLSSRLNSSQGKELSLEDHWRLIRVQLHTIEFLFSPFHINCKQKYFETRLFPKMKEHNYQDGTNITSFRLYTISKQLDTLDIRGHPSKHNGDPIVIQLWSNMCTENFYTQQLYRREWEILLVSLHWSRHKVNSSNLMVLSTANKFL